MTNRFVSFLKTVGLDALKCANVVGNPTNPLVQMAENCVETLVPASRPAFGILGKLGGMIQTAEAAAAVLTNGKNGTGIQKLQAVTPLIAQEVLATELIVGKVVDQAMYMDGCKDLASAIAKIYNSQVKAGATAAPAVQPSAPIAAATPALVPAGLPAE